MSDYLVEIKNEHLSFFTPAGEVKALNDVSLHLSDGEVLGIVGESGCGKSTLLRLLLGFENPESGSIFYDHYNLANVNKSSLRRHIGTCMQDKNLFGGTLFDNITLNAPLSSYDDAWEAARLAGVDEDIREMPMQMHTLINDSGTGISGGQKQRIAIAGAVAMRPECIVFDEPTAMLDPSGRRQVMDIIRELNNDGITCILITHFMEEAAMADRVVVMHQGRIDMTGSPSEVFAEREHLTELDLDVPPVTALCCRLAELGLSVPTDIVDSGKCVEAILSCFSEEK